MKQAILKFPKDKASEFAKWFAEQGIITNLSFILEGDGFFSGNTIVAIVCFPEDKATLFEAKFQNYIKPKI